MFELGSDVGLNGNIIDHARQPDATRIVINREGISARKDLSRIFACREDSELLALLDRVDSVPINAQLDKASHTTILQQQSVEILVIETHRVARNGTRVVAQEHFAGIDTRCGVELSPAIGVVEHQFGILAETCVASECLGDIGTDHQRVLLFAPTHTDHWRQSCAKEGLRGDTQIGIFAVVEIEVEVRRPQKFLR